MAVPTAALGALAAVALVCSVESSAQRGLPAPMQGHPGNVFLAGESVSVPLPDSGTAWVLVDYEEKQIARIPAGQSRANLGALPVGFYRLRPQTQGDWVSLAVLQPLRATTPLTSPIGVDVAMAWFYEPERMPQVASLCALAGMNHVRDRLAWGHMEPERGEFAGPGKYDASAEAQSRAALRVLQVNHSSPGWANPDGRRFPLDLRDAYRFYREMALRWKGQVGAFEPWNEADIGGFGGHTGSEMAALQKASYLGLKAGNPSATACMNVFALHNRAHLDDLAANEAWPYFDTYNLHHYEGFDAYPRLYADHRAVSAGRPLWVTECAVPVRWAGDEKLREPTEADLRVQAERIAKVYACSLHEGSAATFYFILGHYVEGQTQFGIIRQDLTPRPAYVALAAAGRLLADARPIGRLEAPEGVRAYAFHARPDGQDRVVVVAWLADGTAWGSLALPAQPNAMLDHLGRDLRPSSSVPLSTAPTFCVLPSSAASRLRVTPTPPRPRTLPGKPSQVVLHPVWPTEATILIQSAYRVSATEPTASRLDVYNFGAKPISGTITAQTRNGWRVEGLGSVTVGPMGRLEVPIRFVPGPSATSRLEQVRFMGRFGSAGRVVASVRLAPQGSRLAGKDGKPLPRASEPAAWELLVSGGPAPRAVADGKGVVFEATPDGDPWFYPRIAVGASGVPRGVDGLACTITLLEGEGQFRAIFDEKNGSGYVADFANPPRLGVPVETVALFDGVVYGAGWSAPDPNGRLDPPEIVTLKIGANCKAARIRFRVENVRWVKQ